MIPYISFNVVHIGPIPIQVWGFFVASGIFVAIFLSSRKLKKNKLQHNIVWDLGFWILLAAFVGARVFHVLFYDLSYYVEHPLEILFLWQGGLSIMGGFLGAVLSSWIYFIKKKISFWQYADQIVFYLPLGIGIGRIGCTLIHDHPGVKCFGTCVFALDGPNGPQYDLGFLLSINGFLMFLVFIILEKISKKINYTALFLLWYGIVRFFLDFLRAWDGPIVDARFWALTPAQYLSIVFIGLSVFLFWRGRGQENRV